MNGELSNGRDRDFHHLRLTALLSYHAGAWNEVSQRVASRQATQVQFAALVIALSGAAIAALELDANNSDVPSNILLLIVSGGAVALSWCFNAWVKHNEGILGVLSKFGKSLEYQIADLAQIETQGWFEGKWLAESLNPRRFSDFAMGVLHLCTAVPSILTLVLAEHDQRSLPYSLHYFLIAMAVAPAYWAAGTYFNRKPGPTLIRYRFTDRDDAEVAAADPPPPSWWRAIVAAVFPDKALPHLWKVLFVLAGVLVFSLHQGLWSK